MFINYKKLKFIDIFNFKKNKILKFKKKFIKKINISY